MNRKLFIWLVCSLLAALVYHHQFLKLDFFWDDFSFLNHPVARLSVGGQPHSLADWLRVWSPQHGWFYRPAFLNYWMLMHTAGLNQPFVMHGVGLLLHGLNIFLWGWLVMRLSRRWEWGLVASVAFLLLQQGEEAVWWIASHSTLFAVAGLLASAHCWLTWRTSSRTRWFLSSLALFWLGCCFKNDAAAGVMLFPLIDVAVRDVRPWRERLVQYLSLLNVWIVYTAFERQGARLWATVDVNYKTVEHFDLGQRFTSLCSWIDNFTGVTRLATGDLTTVLCLAAVVATGWLLITSSGAHKRPVIALSAFSVLTMLPFPLAAGGHAKASRFLYLPSLSWTLLLVVTVVLAGCAALSSINRRETPVSAAGLVALLLVIATQWRPNWQGNDPAIMMLAAFLVVVVMLIAWRAGWLDGRVAAICVSAIFAQTVTQYFFDSPLCLVAAAVVAVLSWRQRPDVALGLLFVAWMNWPVMVVALLVREAALSPAWKRFETRYEPGFTFPQSLKS